jgi:hypothetical protein
MFGPNFLLKLDDGERDQHSMKLANQEKLEAERVC